MLTDLQNFVTITNRIKHVINPMCTTLHNVLRGTAGMPIVLNA